VSVFVGIKRLFKHSAVYGVGHIVSRSINFLLLPLYTNILPRDVYGVAGLMFAYISFLMILYTYGVDAAFFRYYILEENVQKRKTIFSTAFLTVTSTTVLLSTSIFVMAEPIANLMFSAEVRNLGVNLVLLVEITSGILLLDAIAFLPFLMLRAEERSLVYAIYKFINVIVNIGANVFFLIVMDLGIEGLFYANLCASGVVFILLLRTAFRNLSFSFSGKNLKELLLFGLPYIPSNFSFVVMDMVDRPMLERLAGIESAGLFNAGVKLGMFMALFVAAFRFAWNPFFLTTSKQDNAREIYARVLSYLLLACFTVFLAISMFVDDLVRFDGFGFTLIGEEYWSSTVVVPVIMLAYLIYAAYNNFLVGVYLKKKMQYLAYITVTGMIVNVVANYLLIPKLDIMGPAWARLASYSVMAVCLYFVSQRLYPIDFEWLRITKLVVIALGLFAISTLDAVAGNLFLKAIVFLSFPGVLYLSGFFNKQELARIKRFLVAKRLTRQ
jgi:O-antigen/teichoic acid export membrane protein